MRRSLIGILAAVVVVAGACGGGGDDGADASGGDASSDGGGQNYTVRVDGESDEVKLATTAYFPNELKVAPGSKITFASVFTGEPHTVTLGKLVDAALKAGEAAPPDATEEPPELQKLPALLPDGPGDANQMAANACYLERGDPPADKACPKVADPAPFDGTQSLYNSGFLPEGAKFELQLADDIAPGTYGFFCLLHRMGMTGEFTVVEKGADADSPKDVEKAGDARLAVIVKAEKVAADATAKGDLTPFAPAKPGQVVAGGAANEVQEGLLRQFGPEDVSITKGDTVTWIVLGPHTISFNAPEDVASSALIKAPDGAFHANEKAFAPQGGPGQSPPGEPVVQGGPPPAPRIVDGGTFDGTGFRSSGIFVSFPPALDGYKLTFTKAGTYNYECLIHPEMEGTVKVA
jgi:plastocyanin